MNNLNNLNNKEIKNKNGENGVVTKIDKDYVYVKYESGETKKYSTNVTFQNNFLTFLNEEDTKIINDYFKKDEEENKTKNAINSKAREAEAEKIKRIEKEFNRLHKKESSLKHLFGEDFIYKPNQEFNKKYYRYTKKMETEWEKFVKGFARIGKWHNEWYW